MVGAAVLSVTTFGTVSAESYQGWDQFKTELSQSPNGRTAIGSRGSGEVIAQSDKERARELRDRTDGARGTAKELRGSGFSPQQATFITRCIAWASEARPDVNEREVWMFCAKALIRLETLQQRKETTYSS